MHATCPTDIPPLAATACAPGSAATLIALGSQVDDYLQNLLATITPDMLEADGRLRLVVANETLASVVRGLLEARGHTHVDVEVAAPVAKATYPAPPIPKQKELVPFPAPSGRYARMFTQQQPPTTKARKAARKRARAGCKASR